MTHADWVTIIPHILIFLATVLGFVTNWLRDSRFHRWHKTELGSIRRTVENGSHGESGK